MCNFGLYTYNPAVMLTHVVLQLKSLAQKLEQTGSDTARSSALAQLQEKEAALQASALQLFSKRAKEVKDGSSLQVTFNMPTLRRTLALQQSSLSCLALSFILGSQHLFCNLT